MGRGLLVDVAVEVCGNISVSDGHSIADDVRDAIRSAYPEVVDVVVHVNTASAPNKEDLFERLKI